jgi:hypothetical protein
MSILAPPVRRQIMKGVITDQDLDQAEEEFPGIARFFANLIVKPRTFLELLAQFEHWCEPAVSIPAAA